MIYRYGKRIHFFLSPLFGTEKGTIVKEFDSHCEVLRDTDGKIISLHKSEIFPSKKELCETYIRIFKDALKPKTHIEKR